MKNLTKAFATLSIIFTLAFAVSAQGGGAPEDWHLKYGREYYEAGDFENAAMYFEQGTKMNPQSAKAFFFLGQALLKLKKNDKANAAFQKAVEIDPAYEEGIADILGVKDKSKSDTKETIESRADSAPFKVGDKVEVKEWTSEQWVPCTVLSVRDSSGDGTRFEYKAHCQSGRLEVDWRVYSERIRAVSTSKNANETTQTNSADALFYADYTCNQWNSTTVLGILTLKANGNYSFRGNAGKYTYDEATGKITWTSGYLNADENTTKFRRNKNTAQIDITFKTAKGNLDWECGTNLK